MFRRCARHAARTTITGLVALVVATAASFARAQQSTAPRHASNLATDAGAADAAADVATDSAAGDAASGAPADASTAPESIEARRVRAGTEFAEGMASYRRGDYLAAAAHFDAAYRALPDPAPLFNLARSWEGANDIPHAIDAYERYLAAAPNAPDAEEVRHRIETLRLRPTEIFVSSDPAGAFVYVDEDPDPQRLPTPLVLQLPPGPHVIVLDRDGYRRAVRRFEAHPGVTETLQILLQPDPGRLASAALHGRLDPRIANRRSTNLLSARFSFLVGGARAWNGQPLALSIGGEASLFIGRSIATTFHFERVEPDGVWTILTGDFGYVLPFEDFDIGLFAVAGAAYGWMSYNDYLSHAPLQLVTVGGFEARVDWVFHPRLAVGMFFRAVWRNFFVAPVEPLNSLGLSVSLFL